MHSKNIFIFLFYFLKWVDVMSRSSRLESGFRDCLIATFKICFQDVWFLKWNKYKEYQIYLFCIAYNFYKPDDYKYKFHHTSMSLLCLVYNDIAFNPPHKKEESLTNSSFVIICIAVYNFYSLIFIIFICLPRKFFRIIFILIIWE